MAEAKYYVSDRDMLRRILYLSDTEAGHIQSSDDMQSTLEKIHELIAINLPNLTPDTHDELAVTEEQRSRIWDNRD